MNTKPFVWNFRGRRSIRFRDRDYSQPGDYFVTICTNGRECLFGKVTNGRMTLNETGLTVKASWNAIPEWFPNVARGPYVIMPNHFHAIITIRDIEIPVHASSATISDIRDTDAPVGAGSPRPDQDGTTPNRGAETATARGAETAPLPGPRLGEIVARFKYETTKAINQSLGTPGQPLWQRNYWESCINTERQYANVEEYIINNPAAWERDELNPAT